MRQRVRIKAEIAGVVAVLSLALAPGLSATPLTIAVADFDYKDTSGEVKDQSAEHKARVAHFAELVRENLSAQGDTSVLPFDCPQHPCTPIKMGSDDFIAAARRTGARFIVYGGILKVSTLVQNGLVVVLDLQNEKLILTRTVSFRGDNDEAFSRAAAFVGETVSEAIQGEVRGCVLILRSIAAAMHLEGWRKQGSPPLLRASWQALTRPSMSWRPKRKAWMPGPLVKGARVGRLRRHVTPKAHEGEQH